MKIKKDLNDPLFQEDCTVIIDEIKMTSVHEVFDPSTCTYFGKVTLGENRDQLADNALVFLLAGLKTKWKQVVAFHFTSKNMVGSEIKPVLEEVIKLAENIGLKVHNVTSDMSGANQGLWKSFNLWVENWSSSNIHNSIEHPCDKTRKLLFTPDVPHALKNIKASLINNKFIFIDDELKK